MACDGLITSDILFDCDNPSIAGLEVNVLLFNRADIDLTAVTFDATNKLLMTNFQLKTGSTGYLLKGVKQVNSTSFEQVVKETGTDKVNHTFNGLILTPTVDNKLQLQNMKDGGDLVAIVEKKYKGEDNVEAFEVLGYNSGLKLTASTYNSNENDGAITFALTSEDGYEEPNYPYNLLQTDYAATQTAFGNKFAQA